jgi:DNA-binding protein HU-beta
MNKGELVSAVAEKIGLSKGQAGEARNPKTGAKVQVPASRSPKFRAGTGLKEALNG